MHMKHSIISPWLVPELTGAQWVEPLPQASYSKVFSKAKSQRLPQSTVWDHAIGLLPGAPNTLPGRLLPLTQEEKAEMHKFVQEHLKRGTICVSKSPYAANFFFVKKKLRPI